jgi:hypothetical protein
MERQEDGRVQHQWSKRVWPGVRRAGLGKAEPGADAGPSAAVRRRLISYGSIRQWLRLVHLAQLLRLRLTGFRSGLAGASFVAVTGAMGDEAGQWRTFGEREIYTSPDVQVRQVDVERAGGEQVWHHVVLLHRVALMVLVDEPGRVLLERRHRLVPDRWGWGAGTEQRSGTQRARGRKRAS